MTHALTELIKQQFPGAVLATHAQFGDETIIVDPSCWKAVARYLKETPATSMEMLSDLTAVDYPDRDPRFEIVAHFHSLHHGHRLRVKTRVGDPDGNTVEVDSLTELYASASWAEREVYDMFGVTFRGHPDLRRILMYPEFIGYPLRRDYPAQRIQPLVPFREVPNNDKLAPFDEHEGMAFGRQTHEFDESEPEVEDLLAPPPGQR